MKSTELPVNSPCWYGYPAVTNVTKAASPRSLAASKASSILPPIPRCISEIDVVSALATLSNVDDDRALTGLLLEAELSKLDAWDDNKVFVYEREVLRLRQGSNKIAVLHNFILSAS